MGDFIRIKLIDAAKTNDLEELEFCLNIGDIDVNAVNDAGVTALLAASTQGNLAVVERLLKHPALDVNVKGKDKKSPLYIACQKGNTNLATLLLKHPDIDVNTQDKLTTTALMAALRARHDEILALLLSHPNIDVNQQKKDGTTALMLATTLGHTKVVQELLKRKDVDVTIANKKGQTADDIAKQKKNKQIVATFKDFAKRKESRASTVRSRVLSGNSKFREYQQSFNRGSSFLSSFSEEEKSFKAVQKNPGEVLTQLIRMQSDTNLAQKQEADDLKERLAVNRIKKETTENIRNKKDSNASDAKSETTRQQKNSVAIVEEPETEKKAASVANETNEEVTTEKPQIPPGEEFATEVGKFLFENDLSSFAEMFYKNHIQTLFVASHLKEFDLTHNLGISNPGDRQKLLKAFAGVKDLTAPARSHDVCFIGDGEIPVASSPEIAELKSKILNFSDISEIFKSVEDTNCLVCVFSSEGFFKEEAAIAAISWAYVHKIKMIGFNPSSDASSALLFKSVLRLGQSLLSGDSWSKLEAFNIGYPNVYDALEHLSKSMAASEQDLIAKIKN